MKKNLLLFLALFGASGFVCAMDGQQSQDETDRVLFRDIPTDVFVHQVLPACHTETMLKLLLEDGPSQDV